MGQIFFNKKKYKKLILISVDIYLQFYTIFSERFQIACKNDRDLKNYQITTNERTKTISRAETHGTIGYNLKTLH